MTRQAIKNPKRPFTCQLKEDDLNWVRQTASAQRLSINALIEIGVKLLRLQFQGPEIEEIAPTDGPITPITPETQNAKRPLSD